MRPTSLGLTFSLLKVCYGLNFTNKLGLDFLLVVYEFYFYNTYFFFDNLTEHVLRTKDTQHLLSLVNDLVSILNNFQETFGWFLFVDLSLLLLFWLSHWFLAAIHIQISALAVAGPVLVILAELARVVGLSCTCERITTRTLQVAMRLQEVKTGLEEQQGVKVS